jgi:hypothetical protein
MSVTHLLPALLDFSPISRVRRNHALEHATMHVLGEWHHSIKMVGRSSLRGFYIYSDVPTENVLAAAQEGLRRLRVGQWQMAIHPNCGSNLAVAGVLAGVGAFLALGGKSRSRLQRLSRLPLACAAAVVGVLLAQPLGPILQARVTTEANVGDLRVLGATRQKRASVVVHFVRTGG